MLFSSVNRSKGKEMKSETRNPHSPLLAHPPVTPRWTIPGKESRCYSSAQKVVQPANFHPLEAGLFGFNSERKKTCDPKKGSYFKKESVRGNAKIEGEV